MTAAEFKAIRKKLGMTQSSLAVELGVKGGNRTIRRWECAEFPVPKFVAIDMNSLSKLGRVE